MKRFILFLSLWAASSALAVAQENDLLQFFPNREGAQLVNKTYDAGNHLLSTTIMTVLKFYEYENGSDLLLGFTMTDPAGNAIDQGTIKAYYENGDFFLSMGNRTIFPDIVPYLSMENELFADFLDYPNPMGDDNNMLDWNPVFVMNGGDYTISSKADKRDLVRVHNYNRQYAGRERVSTPAGDFSAYKITYDVDVTREGKTETFRGVEWYTAGAGIVRSEIYKGNNLQNYTVLTRLTK